MREHLRGVQQGPGMACESRRLTVSQPGAWARTMDPARSEHLVSQLHTNARPGTSPSTFSVPQTALGRAEASTSRPEELVASAKCPGNSSPRPLSSAELEVRIHKQRPDATVTTGHTLYPTRPTARDTVRSDVPPGMSLLQTQPWQQTFSHVTTGTWV